MYFTLLNKVEKKELITGNTISDQELFWNEIMKEHALFIRGGLDPSEKILINTANEFANNYEELINNYNNNPYLQTASSLKETLEFRDFKIAGEEGILTCKIKSIIIPLLADHVLREANHFIRLLNNNSSLNK